MFNLNHITKTEKKELDTAKEKTSQLKYYVPDADIYETNDVIYLRLDVPGCERENVEVTLDKQILAIDAKINAPQIEGFKPVYTEYNVGHFRREFSLTERIDREKISATVTDGVLNLSLPKAAEAKPQKIAVA